MKAQAQTQQAVADILAANPRVAEILQARRDYAEAIIAAIDSHIQWGDVYERGEDDRLTEHADEMWRGISYLESELFPDLRKYSRGSWAWAWSLTKANECDAVWEALNCSLIDALVNDGLVTYQEINWVTENIEVLEPFGVFRDMGCTHVMETRDETGARYWQGYHNDSAVTRELFACSYTWEKRYGRLLKKGMR